MDPLIKNTSPKQEGCENRLSVSARATCPSQLTQTKKKTDLKTTHPLLRCPVAMGKKAPCFSRLRLSGNPYPKKSKKGARWATEPIPPPTKKQTATLLRTILPKKLADSLKIQQPQSPEKQKKKSRRSTWSEINNPDLGVRFAKLVSI